MMSDRCLPPGDRTEAPDPMPPETASQRIERLCRENGWDVIHWRRGNGTACGKGLVVHEDPQRATCNDCRRLAVLSPLGEPVRDPGQEG